MSVEIRGTNGRRRERDSGKGQSVALLEARVNDPDFGTDAEKADRHTQ